MTYKRVNVVERRRLEQQHQPLSRGRLLVWLYKN